MNALIDIIIGHYKRIGVFLLIATLPFAYFYTRQHYFSHVSMFFDKHDPALAYYYQFQKKFGNDEIAVVVFQSDDIFTSENIGLIRKITSVAQSMDEVEDVMSLTEAEVATADGDTVGYRKLIPEDYGLNPDTLAAIRNKSLSHPVIAGNLVSKDGTITAIMVELVPTPNNERKHEALNHIRDKVIAVAGDKVRLFFSGGPYLEVEIESLTKRDNMIFTPVTFFVIITVVFLMLRSAGLTILAQINIVAILLWATGLLIMCGETINTMTVIIPPILLAISIADSIHILAYYKECYHKNGGLHALAVAQSIRSMWVPCLFTSLTTAAGFLSFVTSLVRPVKTVGIFTAIGVVIAFCMTLVLLPVLLMVFRPFIEKALVRKGPASPSALNDRFMAALSVLADTVTRHYKIICLIFFVMTAAASLGLFKLRYETSFISYLKDKNPVKQDLLFVDKHFRGTVPVELVLRADSPDHDFTHPESLKMVESIQKNVMERNKDHYTTTFSVADYIKENNRAFNGDGKDFEVIPENREDILDYYELGDAAMLDRVISPDRMEARISFASRFGSTRHSRDFVEYMENEIKPMLGEHLSLTLTGLSGLYNTMDRNLKLSQARSFASAFVLIFIMMYFVCRNVKLTLISIVPNLFPIAMTLGIMGWRGIPLDGSTIMIASVTIGIAVDDTIHFITWFRRNVEAGLDTLPAILKTFRDTGKPIVMTSVVLCIAYLVLMLGSVKPIIAFGALASLAMFLALVGDLFILPALLMVFKPSFARDDMADETEELASETIC